MTIKIIYAIVVAILGSSDHRTLECRVSSASCRLDESAARMGRIEAMHGMSRPSTVAATMPDGTSRRSTGMPVTL